MPPLADDVETPLLDRYRSLVTQRSSGRPPRTKVERAAQAHAVARRLLIACHAEEFRTLYEAVMAEIPEPEAQQVSTPSIREPVLPQAAAVTESGDSEEDGPAAEETARAVARRLDIPEPRGEPTSTPSTGDAVLDPPAEVTGTAEPEQASPEVGNRPRTSAQRLGIDPKTVPGSKYALPATDGSDTVELYKVEVPAKGKWAGFRFVVRLHENTRPGPRWSKQPLPKPEQVAVLARVASSIYVDRATGQRLEGPEAAAVRYAQTFFRCPVCDTPHRPLTLPSGIDATCFLRFHGGCGT